MDLAAIIIVDARWEDSDTAGNSQPVEAASELFADIPLALLDVVGKSVVHHVADRLRCAGVEAITALTAEALCEPAVLREGQLQPACRPASDTWRAAEEAFSAYAGEGVEHRLLLRLGPYAEFDLNELLHFHRNRRHNVTIVFDHNGPLDAPMVQTGRLNDAAHLIPN